MQLYSSDIIICSNYQIVLSTISSFKEENEISSSFINRMNNLESVKINKNIELELVKGISIDSDAFIKSLYIDYEKYGFVIILNKFIGNDELALANSLITYLNELYS